MMISPSIRHKALVYLFLCGITSMIHAEEPSDDIKAANASEGFTLPALDHNVNHHELSKQQHIFLKRIRIRGNTLLSKEEVETIASPYIGRSVSVLQLPKLRQKITDLYVSKGYITSEVLIPNQDIANGEVSFIAIEGKLNSISVMGTERLHSEYVLRNFDLGDNEVVNLATIQEQLFLLKQEPMIAGLEAELSPGDKRSSSDLALKVKENKPYQLQLALNNKRNPSIGAEQLELRAAYHSLTGWGDTISASFNKTEGLNQGMLQFNLPLRRNLDLFTAYQEGDSDVIEQPFNEIDVESEYYDALLGLRYLHTRRLDREIALTISFQKRKTETFLFGEPFSFSAGVQDGESAVSVLRLSANWLERQGDHTFSVGGTLSRGLDVLQATINSDAPDGRFTSFLGQLQYAYRFNKPLHEIILRGDFTLTNTALLPIEKFSLGGVKTVRGYRENSLIADQGLIASIEYRYGLIHNNPSWGTLQGSTFLDYGIANNKNLDDPTPKHLSSVGLGLNWQPTSSINAKIYAAKALKTIENDDYNWQDSGIHFNIHYTLP